MLYFTALTTLASILFYAYLGILVGRARVQYGVKAPAVTGDPIFERHYRVQMNTLEWMVIYIPCLWLFAFYVNDIGAAVLGLVWIFGRTLYHRDYVADPAKRGRGFMIQAAAAALLCFGTLGDILARIFLGD
jgi:glutathione S-transferase